MFFTALSNVVPNFVLLLLSRGKRTNFEFEFESLNRSFLLVLGVEAALLTFKQFLELDVQYARKIFDKHMTRILVLQSSSAWVSNLSKSIINPATRNSQIQSLFIDLHAFSHSPNWRDFIERSRFVFSRGSFLVVTFAFNFVLILWGRCWFW